MKPVKYLWALFRQTHQEWVADHGSLVAAGLSYFAIFSLIPLILICIAVLGRFFAQSDAKSMVLRQIAGATSYQTAETMNEFLVSANHMARPASIIGILLLLWAASRIFSELQQALNIIWDTSPTETAGLRRVLAKTFKRLRAITMTIAFGVILLVFSIIDIGLNALNEILRQYFPPVLVSYGLPAASLTLSLLLFALVFSLIYKWLPEKKIAWGDVWVGAFFSAIIFTLGRTLIALYFRYSDIASPFGAAGSVIVILVWIYFSMQIFLFGAEFTWVYANSDKNPKRISG